MQIRQATVGIALSLTFHVGVFPPTAVLAKDSADAPPTATQKPGPETTLPGFQGIKWGDSIATAREIIAKLKGFKLLSKSSDKDMLLYTGGKLGDQKVSSLGLDFSDEGFFQCSIIFEGDERTVFSQYDEIKELLKLKYGSPAEDKRAFVKPYYDGDGFEMQAVELGKANITSVWRFPEKGPPYDEGNGLLLTILHSPCVALSYRNWPRERRWAEKAKEKAANDF